MRLMLFKKNHCYW